jgi:hypothetical protein
MQANALVARVRVVLGGRVWWQEPASQIQHSRGDGFYDHRQVGVLEEQRILADWRAVGFTQQAVP